MLNPKPKPVPTNLIYSNSFNWIDRRRFDHLEKLIVPETDYMDFLELLQTDAKRSGSRRR
jgi:hypothetical protein